MNCPLLHLQVTLQYLWEKEYQVLVFYHHPMALEVPFLWPGQMMPSPWANTTDPEKLVQFLQASVTDRRSVVLVNLYRINIRLGLRQQFASFWINSEETC